MGVFFHLLNQTLNSLVSKKAMSHEVQNIVLWIIRNLVVLRAAPGGFGGTMGFQVWLIPAHNWETIREFLYKDSE